MALAKMTSVRVSSQLLLFDGSLFQVDPALPLRDYPKTTPEHPLALLSRDVNDFHRITIPHTCEYGVCYLNEFNINICFVCLFCIFILLSPEEASRALIFWTA